MTMILLRYASSMCCMRVYVVLPSTLSLQGEGGLVKLHVTSLNARATYIIVDFALARIWHLHKMKISIIHTDWM